MKRSIWFSLIFAFVFIVSGCGGGSSSGSATSTGSCNIPVDSSPGYAAAIIGTWNGSDDYGTLSITFNADCTFSGSGTLSGGGSRSASGTYSFDGTNASGLFTTNPSCTGPFSAAVSGNNITGHYNDSCGHNSNFSGTRL